MSRHVLFLAAILSIILVLACAGCSELPGDGREDGSGGEDGAMATPTPTPSWVKEATPIRTPEPEPTTVSFTQPEPTPEHTATVYKEIYNKNVYLLYDVIALNYDLKVPAMIIDFDINPDMYTDKMEKTSSYGSKEQVTFTKKYPEPCADLIITIIDRDTGDIVEEHDFAQFTEEHEKHTITLRYPGAYQLEITGNNVDVGIAISVPEANLVDGEEPFQMS